MWHHAGIVLKDVSEERIASIFRIQETLGARIRHEQVLTEFLASGVSFFFYPEDEEDMFLRNVG
jgi:hypothetical protein